MNPAKQVRPPQARPWFARTMQEAAVTYPTRILDPDAPSSGSVERLRVVVTAPSRPAPAKWPAAFPAGGSATLIWKTEHGHVMATELSESARPATLQDLPTGFRSYGAGEIDRERACLVGASTDEDGMHQRPVVALAAGKERVVTWARHLDGLEDAHGSRATHCVLGDGALYVLLQSDTQAAQALSQTVLTVAKLDLQGDVLAVGLVDVPGTMDQAYSAYVHEVSGAFSWEAGQLKVEGEYFLMADPEQRKPFVLTLAPDLAS